MTQKIDIGDNISLCLVKSDARYFVCSIHIEVYKNNIKLQPIIRFDKISSLNQYTIFKWRDEGYLPNSIKTIGDAHDRRDCRVMIMGVDEI